VKERPFRAAKRNKGKDLFLAPQARAQQREAHRTQLSHTIVDVINSCVMARPSRNTSRDDIQDGPRTFFVTSQAIAGRSLLQTERMANLFIDVLRNYVAAKKFRLHDFVVSRTISICSSLSMAAIRLKRQSGS